MIIRNINPTQQYNKKSRGSFEKRLFKVLVGSFMLGICVYIYSLGSVVYGVVERRSLEKDIAHLNSDIGSLEQTYLEKTGQVGFDSLATLGYTKPSIIYYESQERVALQTNTNQKQGF